MFKNFILSCLSLLSLFALTFGIARISAASEQTTEFAQNNTAFVAVQPNTVLELFTSQGCSTCPAANKFVRDISDDPGVLVLSYSVDYWDYLGWRDTFGKPEFSARQRAYGQHFNGKVYTPQMVLNGTQHNTRFTRNKVSSSILKPSAFDITFSQGTKPNTLSLEIGPKDANKPLSFNTKTPQKYTVMAVTYEPGLHRVPVKRGENKGRVVKLANVVTGSERIAVFEGQTLKRQISKPNKDQALVIFVQIGNAGAIVAAAQINGQSRE